MICCITLMISLEGIKVKTNSDVIPVKTGIQSIITKIEILV